MEKFLGYVVAALAGAGLIVVVDKNLFDHPTLLLKWL